MSSVDETMSEYLSIVRVGWASDSDVGSVWISLKRIDEYGSPVRSHNLSVIVHLIR